MRETLVCIGQMARRPFLFQETGTRVYSYEELCFYMRKHLICYLYSLPEKSLAVWIRDQLHLDRLARLLSKLEDPSRDQMKYFAALFREGNYYSEDEIRRILDEYRILKNASRYQQCKWLGDLFFGADRADMAIAHYQEALKEEGISDGERGAGHHNLGAALTRLFRFRDAKIHFLKAYQYAGDERSLYLYFAITALTQDLDTARAELASFDVSDLLLESFETRYSQMKADFQTPHGAAEFRKLFWLSQNGREEDCDRVQDRFVRKMQREFRSQLGRSDTLFAANLPANPLS